MKQISDAPSQIREALFGLISVALSRNVSSAISQISKILQLLNVKYYCPYKAIFEFGIPLVKLLHTCIVVFSFCRSYQLADCSKSKYPGTNWKKKISERMVPGNGTNKQNNLTSYVKGVRLFGILHSFALKNACPWPIWDTQLKLFSRLTKFPTQQQQKNTTLFTQGKNKMT